MTKIYQLKAIVAKAATAIDSLSKAFNPDQPRDASGRWSSSGSGSGSSSGAKAPKQASKKYPRTVLTALEAGLRDEDRAGSTGPAPQPWYLDGVTPITDYKKIVQGVSNDIPDAFDNLGKTPKIDWKRVDKFLSQFSDEEIGKMAVGSRVGAYNYDRKRYDEAKKLFDSKPDGEYASNVLYRMWWVVYGS